MLPLLDRRSTRARGAAALIALAALGCNTSVGPDYGVWSAPLPSGGPAATRDSDAADFADGKLFVWGDAWSRGAVFDVAANAWHDVAKTEPRLGAAALWANGRVLLWGDHGPGEIYDPTADAWTPMSTANAPAAHENVVAVWTGTTMIVWGGADLNALLPPALEGGVYDPARDAWTAMSTANAPSARTRPAYVWTGSKMVVWGGQDEHGRALGDGAVYDPVTNAWTAMSAANAPSPRFFHAATWTGKAFFVFGGTDGTTAFDDGAQYDPDKDTWKTLSAKDAPAGRIQATAVWDGSEVIVWSGSDLTTGARWAPVTDAWTRITIANAPVGRSLAFAFWTGDHMLVYGGDGANAANGATYSPVSR